MQLISADVSKTAWREFLERQPAAHPDFFKTPQTFQGQEYFKSLLELIAKRSMKCDSLGGLVKFINAVQNPDARERMWTWVDKFTPIREQVTRNGEKQYVIVRDYRAKCSLIEGMEHPYYSLKPQPRKHFSGRGTRPIPEHEPESEQKSMTTAPAVTELDFQKKLVKHSLNKFLADRSVENRKDLIAAIQAIPLGAAEKKGVPFLQGGAIGLKK